MDPRGTSAREIIICAECQIKCLVFKQDGNHLPSPTHLGEIARTRTQAIPSFCLSSLDFVLCSWPAAGIPRKRNPPVPLAFPPDGTCRPCLSASVGVFLNLRSWGKPNRNLVIFKTEHKELPFVTWLLPVTESQIFLISLWGDKFRDKSPSACLPNESAEHAMCLSWSGK